MASLFKLLFDTMLFDATLRTCGPQRSARTIEEVTISEFAGYTYFDTELDTGQEYEITDEDRARPVEEIPIWGWSSSADPSTFTDITCKVRDDDFKEYVVLDKLEFGSGFGGAGFEPAVRVSFMGKEFSLSLSADTRLASFCGWGRNNGMHPLWRLKNETDMSELHVMAFDLDFVGGTATPLTQLPSGHSDAPEMAKFLMSCHRLAKDSTDESKIGEALFTDSLWHPVTGLVGDVIDEIFGDPNKPLAKIVDLAARPVRVLVTTSLTPCQERDDYQPGSPAGVGRLYPHVMVRATMPLDWIDASVRFTRPTSTTIKNGHVCGCSEMNDDMGALLVADADAGNLQDGPMIIGVETPSLPGLPLPPVWGALGQIPLTYWNNLFNYYVKDAHVELANIDIHMVKHARAPKTEVDGPIQRKRDDPDTRHKITRVARQGAFDNIHMAPTMKVPAIAEILSSDGKHKLRVDDDVRARWSLDRVGMAPFCVHDCFHMHWRWANNMNTEPGAFGWQGGIPHAAPGRTMVPENQDVDLQITQKNQFIYKSRAHTPTADSWQVFCHHGAGYLLSILFNGKAAPRLLSNIMIREATRDWSGVRFWTILGTELTPEESWAVFYWHMQFYVDLDEGPKDDPNKEAWPPTKPNDRTTITDLQAILDF